MYTDDNDVRVTEFKFTSNQQPVRFAASGNFAFVSIYKDTAAERPLTAMTCPKGHQLNEAETPKIFSWQYHHMNCSKCGYRPVKLQCSKCSSENQDFFACQKCLDSDRDEKNFERRDPAKHPTYLRCVGSCSFSLQIPNAGGADPESGCYLLAMEVRFKKLPMVDKLQTLLRISLPEVANSLKNRSSAYLDTSGRVIARQSAATKSVDTLDTEKPTTTTASLKEAKDALKSAKSILEKTREALAKLAKDKEKLTFEISAARSASEGALASLQSLKDALLEEVTKPTAAPGSSEIFTSWAKLMLPTVTESRLEEVQKVLSDHNLFNSILESSAKYELTSDDLAVLTSDLEHDCFKNKNFAFSHTAIQNLRDWIANTVAVGKSRSSLRDLEKTCESVQIDKSAAETAITKAKAAVETAVQIASAGPPTVLPGVWCTLSFNVNPSIGYLGCFIDGRLSHEISGINRVELELQHKLIVFGGGKPVHSKGTAKYVLSSESE